MVWVPSIVRRRIDFSLAVFKLGAPRALHPYYDNYDPDRAYHDAVAKPEEWYTSALAAFGIGSDD